MGLADVLVDIRGGVKEQGRELKAEEEEKISSE